jgi:hypothetical protein
MARPEGGIPNIRPVFSSRASAVRLGSVFGLLVLVLVLVSLGLGLGRVARAGGASQGRPAALVRASFSGLCGGLGQSSPPAQYAHVIWVWLENHSYNQIIGPNGSKAAAKSPYVNGTLVPGCGLATNYYNISHPSLPNYLAAASGSTDGVTNNCAPSKCPQTVPSLFGQLAAAGKTWRTYAQGMAGACSATATATYESSHNPALYYTDAKTNCPAWDVPFDDPSTGFLHDLAQGTLPNFSFVIPDQCNSSENCSVTTADLWLQQLIPQIQSSSAYQSAQTVVFVSWDEGSHGQKGVDCTSKPKDTTCEVATLVISPYTRPGTKPLTLYTHYSLLRTTEDLLGLPHLAHAADTTTTSLRTDFHI